MSHEFQIFHSAKHYNPDPRIRKSWHRLLIVQVRFVAAKINEVETENSLSNLSLYFDLTQLRFFKISKEQVDFSTRERVLIYRKGAWKLTDEDYWYSNRGVMKKFAQCSWMGFRGILYERGYFLEFDYGEVDIYKQNFNGVILPNQIKSSLSKSKYV